MRGRFASMAGSVPHCMCFCSSQSGFNCVGKGARLIKSTSSPGEMSETLDRTHFTWLEMFVM